MKLLILLAVFLFASSQAFAQEFNHFTKQDSAKFMAVWHRFTNALVTKDRSTIKKLSLKLVDCVGCQFERTVDEYYSFVVVDTFINQFTPDIKKSLLWKKIKSNKFSLKKWTYKDFHPRSLPLNTHKQLTIYEIGFFYRPKDLDEGVTKIFEFVLLHNTFKFYGIASIP